MEITAESSSRLPIPCFKTDGHRFNTSDTTLKLAREGPYKLSLICSPPSTITHAELISTQGLDPPLNLELVRTCEEGLGISTHSTDWECMLDASEKNTRHVLELHLNVQDFGTLVLPLQIKVYHSYDKSLVHGSRLRHLQYLFKSKSDTVALTSMVPIAL